MGLNFKKWLVEKLSGGAEKKSLIAVDWAEFFGLMDQVYLRELAFWTCVNKIANALSKCEFRTYYHHEPVKKAEYYLWNVEPNQNQNASAFLTKLIGKLYLNNEALVIESSGQLYVADDYQKQVYALYDYQFTGVTVDDFTFGKTFYQSDVLFFQLNSVDMRQLVNLLYSSYNELMQYAANAYRKSRGSRGILDIDAQAQAEDDFSETLQELMTVYFKSSLRVKTPFCLYMTATSTRNFSQKPIPANQRGTSRRWQMIFSILRPEAFLSLHPWQKETYRIQEKLPDELLTFCIDPLARLLKKR